jgi:hypothetical protein
MRFSNDSWPSSSLLLASGSKVKMHAILGGGAVKVANGYNYGPKPS